MASHRPPQKKDVENRWWSLVLFMDAINSLSLNPHLLIQPFFATAQLPQKPFVLLQFSGLDYLSRFRLGCDDCLALHLWVQDMASLDIVRTSGIMRLAN